jgi:hypothetical protein
MFHLRAYVCLLSVLEIAAAQAPQGSVPSAPVPLRPRPAAQVGQTAGHAEIQPVVISRTALDNKIVTLRLAPRVATSIRLPEPVNSVVLGDPIKFQAEHSEHEPELVTVKPVSSEPAQTNLLITTAAGHQLNLLLISSGEQGSGLQTVDVLLAYGKPQAGSFLIEENPFSSLFVSETQRLGSVAKGTDGAPVTPSVASLTELVKAAGPEISKSTADTSRQALDKLLARQKQAPLPQLYGQHPGEIDAGPRVKAGVSEVLDEGKMVVVLFSVMNPASHAIEILPPQVQLGGKLKKKWTTAEQLYVIDFRLSTQRIGAGQRADGVVVFERPEFKQSNETLFLQIADSGAVDLPALAPVGFGISNVRGGSAYESR